MLVCSHPFEYDKDDDDERNDLSPRFPPRRCKRARKDDAPVWLLQKEDYNDQLTLRLENEQELDFTLDLFACADETMDASETAQFNDDVAIELQEEDSCVDLEWDILNEFSFCEDSDERRLEASDFKTVARANPSTVRVYLNRESELTIKSKLSVPWKTSVHKSDDDGVEFCDVPSDRLAQSVYEIQCEFCADSIQTNETYVVGCATHAGAHLQCAAIVYKRMGDHLCCGAARSRCVPKSVPTPSRDVMNRISDLAVIKLTRQIEYVRSKRCDTKTIERRSDRVLRTHTKVLEHLLAPADWTTTDETYALKSRSVQPGREENSTCVVCGLNVRCDDSSVTCSKHKTHDACYAFFRYVRDQWMKLPTKHECPSALFGYPECQYPTPAVYT
jgi:hypothetical protein